ncbi:MAG: FAD:protein FMN transferase [Planctomycetota bacterium]|nr:FAD:protein FMN transferase [Planctomycetota bacterium]
MSQSPSSRRDFLQGKSALRAAENLLPNSGPLPSAPGPVETAAPRYLVQVGRTAMACEFQVLLNAGEADLGTEAALTALDQVNCLDEQLSVYRPESEVSVLNRLAANRRYPVTANLFSLLKQCVELYHETSGAFDITSGPLSKTWGFYRRQGRLPAQDEIDRALKCVGASRLEVCPTDRTITFGHPELEVNLGGIGKGYALDQCQEILRNHDVTSFLLHGGRSSVLASGHRTGHDVHPDGWLVALKHPLKPDTELGQVRLRNRALGTSGSANQFFHFQGRRFSHVLDPRNGWPAEELLSATVLAPSAALADALSTAFFVLGYEPSSTYCQEHADIGAILVSSGPRSGALEIRTLGLSPGEWLPGHEHTAS